MLSTSRWSRSPDRGPVAALESSASGGSLHVRVLEPRELNRGPRLMGFVGTTSVDRDDLTITAGPDPLEAIRPLHPGRAPRNVPVTGSGAVCISFPVDRLPIVQSQGLMSYEVQLQDAVQASRPSRREPPGAPIAPGHRGAGFGLSNALSSSSLPDPLPRRRVPQGAPSRRASRPASPCPPGSAPGPLEAVSGSGGGG